MEKDNETAESQKDECLILPSYEKARSAVASLGLGLIGLGRHGQRYAHHLLGGIPHCRLVAVCRRDVSTGREFATQHGLSFYHDYHDLLADPSVHAVLIVTPPAEAIRIALDAIRYTKPFLIEKPLGCTAHDAQRIVTASIQTKIPLMVAHTLRYEEAIRQLKQHGERIGPWQYLVMTNRLPRATDQETPQASSNKGALLEIGIHQLDLVRFVTGHEVAQVSCDMERQHPTGPDVRAWASLKTERGLPCLLDVSRMSTARVTRAEIVGETGQLIADWTSHVLVLVDEKGASTSIPLTPRPTIPRVISDFVQAIHTKAAMPITGLDGLRAVQIADACYESAKTGKTIILKPN